MRVEDTDKALEAYEEAVRGDPTSPTLAATVARALTTTHNYKLAKQYYLDALKKVRALAASRRKRGSSSKDKLSMADDDALLAGTLQYELARLYQQLRNGNKAAQVLQRDFMGVGAAMPGMGGGSQGGGGGGGGEGKEGDGSSSGVIEGKSGGGGGRTGDEGGVSDAEAMAGSLDGRSLPVLVQRVRNLLLLSSVLKGEDDMDTSLLALKAALIAQRDFVIPSSSEGALGGDGMGEGGGSGLGAKGGRSERDVQREACADILFALGSHHEKHVRGRGVEAEAESLYQQALRVCPTHAASRLALARLFLRANKVAECKAQCASLQSSAGLGVGISTPSLSADERGGGGGGGGGKGAAAAAAAAAEILADLHLAEFEFSEAAVHYESVLTQVNRNPSPYSFSAHSALARLLDIRRRGG